MEIPTIRSKFLQISGMVEYIHFSKSAIYKMIKNNEIPYIKLKGKILFDIEEINAWVKSGGKMPEELPAKIK